MPLPLAAAAAAAGIAESIGNPLFSHLTNVKNRKFAREMYSRQRQDALSDWEMQNEYNSPRAQMQRFQEAGLNPHLIYGQMSEVGGVRSSSSSGGQAEAPRLNAAQNILAYQNVQQAKAQTDNLHEINENLKVSRDKMRAEIASIITSTTLTDAQKQKLLFELGIESELRETTIEGRKAHVDKTKVETQSIHSQIIQQWEKQPHQVKNLMMDILQKERALAKTQKEMDEIDRRIKLLDQEWKINSIDEKLAEEGFNPKNPGMMKWLWNMMQKLFR